MRELRAVFRDALLGELPVASKLARKVAASFNAEVSEGFVRTSWLAEWFVTIEESNGDEQDLRDASRTAGVEVANNLKESRGRGEPAPIAGLW